MVPRYTYNGKKIKELLDDNGLKVSNISNASCKYIDGGVNEKTIYRMINNEVTPLIDNMYAVMKVLAEEIGHNDVNRIKEQIEFQTVLKTENKKLKSLWEKDTVSIIIVLSLLFIQVTLVVFNIAQSSTVLIVLTSIFLITLTLLTQQTIIYQKTLIVAAIILFFVLAYLNSTNFFRNNFSIENIAIVESECLWENKTIEDKDKKEIVGFSENTKDIWFRWRKYPTLIGKDSYYDNTPMDKNLRKVYEILNNNLKNGIYQDNKNQYFIQECNNNYSVIADSSFKLFFRRIIESFRGFNNMIQCVNSIWPSKDDLDFYARTDTAKWSALKYFQNDFFRERYPIFEVEIKNDSDNQIRLERASVEMRDLEVDMFPKDHAPGYTLEKIADYEWQLTNMSSPTYIKWLEDSIKAYPHGYKAIYKDELDISYLDLNPKLVIEKESMVLIYIRIKDGYRWPCKIRFSFFDSENNIKESNWYSFNPVSHPSINLYNYEKKY